MPEEITTPLGTRLRQLRIEKGLSREKLGELAGISAQMIAKTERGTRNPRLPKLVRLAAALDVDLSELTGRRPRLGDAEDASVLAVRDAILSPSVIPGLGIGETAAPVSPQRLQAAIDDAAAAYWSGDLGHLTAMLPGLIAAARATRKETGTSAAGPLAQAYERAALLLVHLGKEDLAAISAERAIAASSEGDDELLHAMTRGTYAWVLLHQGRLAEAEKIAADAAHGIEPPFSSPPDKQDEHARQLAAYGNLMLTALGPAAAAGRDGGDYIRAASAAAERIGYRVRLYGTSFAAASVHMQATYAYAVNREPGRALEAAGKVRLEDLPGPISRGRHLQDIAQAHVDAGHDDEAIEALRQALAAAPVWFRHQGVAGVLVSELMGRQLHLSRPLQELAAATEAEGYAAYFRAGAKVTGRYGEYTHHGK